MSKPQVVFRTPPREDGETQRNYAWRVESLALAFRKAVRASRAKRATWGPNAWRMVDAK